MDVKILAAVLVSLAAVFAGADGGMFSTSDLRQAQKAAGLEAPKIPSSNSLIQNLPIVGKYFRKPEPENRIKARITVEGPAEVKLNNAEMEAQNLTEIDSRTMKIRSDQDILFKNFNGKVRFGNISKIQGTATGLKTSGVNLTTPVKLDTKINTPLIKVKETVKTALHFETASIAPVKDSDFPLNTQKTRLDINSFTGDILIYPGNSTLFLNGKVDTVNAGKSSYGG